MYSTRVIRFLRGNTVSPLTSTSTDANEDATDHVQLYLPPLPSTTDSAYLDPDLFLVNMGLTTFAHTIFTQVMTLVDAVMFFLLLGFFHTEPSIHTVTCNSQGHPLEIQEYVCAHRGTFNVAWSVIIESLVSAVLGCVMSRYTMWTLQHINSNYLVWKVVFAVSAILDANVVHTLCGLFMQSTYVYSALCISTLFLAPVLSLSKHPHAIIVSFLALLSAVLPLFTVLAAPATPSKDLDSIAVSMAVVHVIYMVFVAAWSTIAKATKLVYKIDVWTFVGTSIAYKYTIRVLVVVAILQSS